MHRQQRQCVDELERKVAIAGRVDAVGCWTIEIQECRPSTPDPAAASRRPPHPIPTDKHSAACGNPRAVPHRAETSRHTPAASGRSAPAQPSADAYTPAWRHPLPVPRDPRSRCTVRRVRAAVDQSSPARTAANRSRSARCGCVRCAACIPSPRSKPRAASRRSDEHLPLRRLRETPATPAAFSPICRSPCRMLISSSADRMPAFFSARACAPLAASSYCSNRRSKPNDRCQRSKSGSSGCRNLPDHIFIVRPPRERVPATATAGRECG